MFVGAQLPWIPILEAEALFEILKSTETVNSRCLDQVGNENVFLQAIFDKKL